MPFNSISPSGPIEFQPKTTSDGGPCNRFWANGWNSFLNQKLAVSHTFTRNSILLTQSELIFYSKCLIVLSDSIYDDYSRARKKEVIKVFNYSKHWRPLGILMGCFNTPSVLWDFLRRRHFSPTLSGVSLSENLSQVSLAWIFGSAASFRDFPPTSAGKQITGMWTALESQTQKRETLLKLRGFVWERGI